MASSQSHDELIQQFCALTSTSPAEARAALEATNWDIEAAVTTWFSSQEGADSDQPEDAPSDDEMDDTPAQQQPGGGRTLGGDGVASRYVPPPAGSSASGSRQPPPGRSAGGGSGGVGRGGAGMRTLRDLQGGGSHAGHGHDDDGDDDEGQDFFAGGEKSGLAVHNPNSNPRDLGNPRDQIESMLDRARRNIPRPGGEDDDEEPRSRFSGRGVTLGGEGTESRVIETNRPQAAARPTPRVQRVLHLWSDGFSVDDGPLFRYDDPANAATLAMINQGRAPLELLNVEHNQEVDLQLDNQKESKFVQPKRKYKPFEGQGQRLGSPTPGATSTTTTTTAPTAGTSRSPPSAAAAPASSSSTSATPDIDPSQPTVTVQIRLADGTQLRTRFNTTSRVSDLYDFVTASNPQSRQRAFALMTTFPSKKLDGLETELSETELKRGGVVVQKWE